MTDVLDDAAQTAVIDSSGNVFADLGLPSSSEDMLKVEISRAIANAIRRRKLTQEQAAIIVETDQAKISAILRGRLKTFSVERLVRFLLALGTDMDIRVSKAQKERPGRLSFVEAA